MQADKEECTTTSPSTPGKYRSLDAFLGFEDSGEEGETTALFYFSLSCWSWAVCTSAGPQKLALFFVMYTSKRSWTCLTNHARFDSNWILIASCKTRVCCWQSLSSSKDSIFSSNFTGSYLLFFKGLARGIILKSSGKSSKVWLKACF